MGAIDYTAFRSATRLHVQVWHMWERLHWLRVRRLTIGPRPQTISISCRRTRIDALEEEGHLWSPTTSVLSVWNQSNAREYILSSAVTPGTTATPTTSSGGGTKTQLRETHSHLFGQRGLKTFEQPTCCSTDSLLTWPVHVSICNASTLPPVITSSSKLTSAPLTSSVFRNRRQQRKQ